jgi:O-antigen/teichoic acid export membrane protein
LSSKPEAFVGATQIFFFLGIAKLIDGLTGINTHILLYSSYYKYNLLFLVFLGMLNVFLNIVLIKQYDIAGAAIATLISLTLYNIAKFLFIKVKLGFSPFDINTIKVIVIGIAVFVIMSVFPSFVYSSMVSIFIKSTIIFILFVGAIYASESSIDFNSFLLKNYKRISNSIFGA